MTSTQGCWLGKQGAGDTSENSQGFCVQVSGKCNGSGPCYLGFLEYKLLLLFVRHYRRRGKVRIKQRGDAGSAMYTLFLLTGLYKAQENQVSPAVVLFADLEPLAERWLVTCWSFWRLAALSVASFLSPECPLLTTAFLFTEVHWSLLIGVLVLHFTLAVTTVIMKILALVGNFR